MPEETKQPDLAAEVTVPVASGNDYKKEALVAKAETMAKGHFGDDPAAEAEFAEWLKATKLGKLPADQMTKDQLVGVINGLHLLMLAPRKTVKVAVYERPVPGPHPVDAIMTKTLTREVQRPVVVDKRGDTKIVKIRRMKESEQAIQPVLEFDEIKQAMKEVPEIADLNKWRRYKSGQFTTVAQVGNRTQRFIVSEETFEKLRAR